MKKLKNLTLMLVLSLCAIVGVTTVNAAGFTISKTTAIVCNPATVNKDTKSKCYIIGKPDGDASSSIHGYVTALFTTKDLVIEGAESIVSGTDTAFVKDQSVNGSGNTWKSVKGTALPTGLDQVRCLRNNDWASNSGLTDKTISDYACATFYSTGTTNAFTPSSIRSNTELNKRVIPNYADYGIIGNYVVVLKDGASTTGDCGSVCVKAWGIADASKYASLDMNGSTAGASDDLARPNACTELHKEKVSENPNPGHTPETGAFTSYAVLTAGALIAIGAIAIAKKNNRFNKI
ncbi:MAG TPA: hypothetical protein DCE23_09370 [Firmicutes bacterium]|nr:hypothetical protein [Bacillota bacterium]